MQRMNGRAISGNTAKGRGRALAVLMLLMSLFLAACGGDGSAPEDTPSAGDGGDVESEPASPSETGSAGDVESEPASPSETGSAGDAGAASDRFEGETLRLIVPYSPGGGYDTYLRVLAPYIENHSGATVVVENEPGAGGLQAANSLAAGSDPTQMMIANGPGFASAWLAGAEGVRFDFDQFSFLGRLVSEPHVLVVAGDSDVESFEQLREQGSFRWGVTGPGSTAIINSTVIGDVFGLEIESVPGFEGSGEIQTALIRGDLDVMSIEPSSAISAIEAGEVRPLVVLSDERSELIPDTPTLTDLELSEEEGDLLDVHFSLFEVGRAIIAAPGLDDADVSALSLIVEAAATDSAFQSQMADQNRPLAFAAGDEVAGMVETLSNAPERYVGLIEQAYQ